MDIYFETCPTLEERLQMIREYSYVDLSEQISHLSLDDELPSPYLATLDDDDRATCFRATLLCHCVTGGTQVPREMQLKAVLADQHGDNSLIAAGTGSGKTLPMALNILLDDPKKKLTTITLSPLKRLQATQENDFNTRYGIRTVIINEDTPRDDKWWAVRHVFPLAATVHSVSSTDKCL